MRGDEDPASLPSNTARKLPGSFMGAPLAWRIGIVLGGPAATFILGILLFALVHITAGKQILPAEIARQPRLRRPRQDCRQAIW